MKEFTVSKYGKEFAIFSATSKCYVLFCKTKKEANIRCNELNKTK